MHVSASSIFYSFFSVYLVMGNLDGGEDLLGGGDGDWSSAVLLSTYMGLTLWWGVLDNNTDNLSVVNDDSTSLESGSTKEIMSVKDESGSGTEGTSVVTNYFISSIPECIWLYAPNLTVEVSLPSFSFLASRSFLHACMTNMSLMETT